MWAITNNTPFAAERCWVRDKDGAEVWLVAVRGTFLIDSSGRTTIAEEQTPVVLAPKFRGDAATSSLLCDSDLHHVKSATDVLVEGHAYAPGGKPAERVEITVKVAGIHKTLRVFGDRKWEKYLLGVVLGEPAPFTKLPVVYERAFGGTDLASETPLGHAMDQRNPVGAGFATSAEHLAGKLAPNIEYPKSLVSQWRDRPPPAGFGPIGGHWAPRVNYVGTYDKAWEDERQPLLPLDFKERYYQCAPEDQQVSGFLRGGEQVELTNLSPSGVLRFQLPELMFQFSTHFEDGEVRQHQANLHTVLIEPDVPRVTLVWHTSLACHHKVLKLRTTAVDLKRRRRSSAVASGDGLRTSAGHSA